MVLKEVILTHRDSCKTYALKRIGLSHLIDVENDTPTIKDLCESKDFIRLEQPQIGCLLIWLGKTSDAIEGYWQPHGITVDGRIFSVKRYDYGHLAVYERGEFISDATWVNDGYVTKSMIRMRKYDDLSNPDLILKYNK